jgi:hypothetical protein
LKRLTLAITSCLLLGIGAMSIPLPVLAQDTTPTPSPCANAPASRLTPNATAKIIDISGIDATTPGAYLKPAATHLGPVLRYLPVGTVLTVTEGPVCDEDGEQWWKTTIGDITGWVTETSGLRYILEPTADAVTEVLPTTGTSLLSCFVPVQEKPPVTPTAPVLRAVFTGDDGTLQYTDNLGVPRTVAQFDPPPLSVDLSPDGSAAMVVTYNGLYWVDLLTGQFALMADATTFGLEEGMFPQRVIWLPDNSGLAVELIDTRDGEVSYPLWDFPIDGSDIPLQIDTGNLPANSVRRSPRRDAVVLLSANDVKFYPSSFMDETPALLEFVPPGDEGDATDIFIPAVSWAQDGSGFYTYIPTSPFADETDEIGGRLWFVSLNEERRDLGSPANLLENDYVIPSPDGTKLLAGRGSTWRMLTASGEVLQELPPVQFLFDWTPDSGGVVFTNQNAQTQYLGADGSTTSAYVPVLADNLFDIRWMEDGTTLYVARGADERLSFSVKPFNADPVFVGLVSTTNAYSVAMLPTAPGLGAPPNRCG